MRPDVCAHQSPLVIDGSPALLGQGGRFRQAIPGLSKTASASLPRPRLRAAVPPRPAMLGAAKRGNVRSEKSKVKSGKIDHIGAIPICKATDARLVLGGVSL